jgi:ACS family hexuronate transporter-like MFS transporter
MSQRPPSDTTAILVSSDDPPPLAAGGSRMTRYRWVICGMIFLATTINYIDRQVIGILAPTLTELFAWSETDYASIISWFSFAYALGYLLMGRFSDRVGTKIGYSVAIVGWSVAAMAHAFVRTVPGFSIARAALGFGEGGNFPTAIKAVGEWFPKRERAFATGIFNAGTNVGAVAAPLLVPWITLTWGWEWAFLSTGTVGFAWLIAWWVMYRAPEDHPRVSPAELAHIRSDPGESAEPVPWLTLLTFRQTWAYMFAKLMSDPVWWFYLYWLPKFLDSNYGVTLAGLALPLVVIYSVADVGSIGGGWLSGFFISRGWSVNRARKITMLLAACLAVPTMLAPAADSMWMAVAFVCMAASAQQWWAANLFTTVSDMFPKGAVASVVGLGGFVGAMGAVVFQRATGYILEVTDSNYSVIFLFAGAAYLIGLLGFHLLAPRLEPVRIRGTLSR